MIKRRRAQPGDALPSPLPVVPRYVQKYKHSEREIEDMMKLLYETPGGARWSVMRKLSGTLESITREQAVRVLDYIEDTSSARGLL